MSQSFSPSSILTPSRLKALIWITILSSFTYLVVSIWVGWSDVVASLTQVGLIGVLIILALSLVNYLLRFVRWQFLLSLLGYRVPVLDNLRIYIAGFGLTIVPGKVGEAVRSIFLKDYNVGYRPSLAVFFSERLSDLLSVLILAGIGVWSYAAAKPALLAFAVALTVFILLLRNKKLLDKLQQLTAKKAPEKFKTAIDSFVDIIRHSGKCMAPIAMLAGLSLGVVAWGAEGYAFYLVLDWMECGIDWQTAMFIYAFAMIVGAVSFLPGGLGGAEATMIGLLILNGVDEPTAVAATLLIRIATLWFAVFLGFVALLFQSKNIKRVKIT